MPDWERPDEVATDPNDPCLGGNVIGGDPDTYHTALWSFLLERFPIHSVLDVGCGEGHCVKYFADAGVNAVGFDGLRGNIERAVAPIIWHDLRSGPFIMPVDLVHCCEVVEHIEERYLGNLLKTLLNGRVIAMTHALPGQIGYHHVNCQPAGYWIGKLEPLGYSFLEAETNAAKTRISESGAWSYFVQSGLIFKKRSRQSRTAISQGAPAVGKLSGEFGRPATLPKTGRTNEEMHYSHPENERPSEPGAPSGANLIDRPSNESWESPWSLRVAGDNRADLEYLADTPGGMRISIQRRATEAEYDIQLNQSYYEVAANNHYRITFRGRADGAREVCLGFSKAIEPWSNLGLYRKLQFTTEWDDYCEDFEATSDDDHGRIHFDLGGAGTSVELWSVHMWRVTDTGLVALNTSEPAKPKDLRTATTREVLAWRDRIVLEASAHMERTDLTQAEAWLRRLETTTIDAWTLQRTDSYLTQIARGRKVVASFDPSRRPTTDEVVIVYGNYPHMFGNVVVNNPIRRHVADFWNFRHDEIESDRRWAGVDQIFVINVEERLDRYDSILRELAAAKAPFDRLTRVLAVKPVPGDAIEVGGAIACLRSHIATLRQAQEARYEHVLVLEDDFCFSSDIQQHLTDLAAFFERRYEYWVCLLATSKYGAIVPKDDLISLSFQRLTGTAGHLVSREGIEQLLPVFETALERLQSTGDVSRYAADTCWAVLQPSGKFLTFRRKFGFQVSSFSDIVRVIARNLD